MGKIMEAVFCVFYMIFVVISTAPNTIMAGSDLFMPGGWKDYDSVKTALARGLVTREQLEINAARVIAMAKRMCKK